MLRAGKKKKSDIYNLKLQEGQLNPFKRSAFSLIPNAPHLTRVLRASC